MINGIKVIGADQTINKVSNEIFNQPARRS
jgi:hypothetical protein